MTFAAITGEMLKRVRFRAISADNIKQVSFIFPAPVFTTPALRATPPCAVNTRG